MTISTLKVKVSKNITEDNAIRLKKILNRDTRIIRRYLGIIHQEYNNLFILKELKQKNKDGTPKKRKVFSASVLDQLTLTTSERRNVKYDLKQEFQRISHNELLECRDVAISHHDSHMTLCKNYLDDKEKRDKKKEQETKELGKSKNKLTFIERKQRKKSPNPTGFPKIRISKNKVPRNINARRYKLDMDKQVLHIMDSLDTNPKMIAEGKQKIHHDYLSIPLVLHRYHVEKLSNPAFTVNTVKIVRSKKEFEAHFALESKVVRDDERKPKAVVGIDLGIKTDAFLAVLTEKGLSYHQPFCIDDKLKSHIGKLNDRISNIQKGIAILKKQSKSYKGLSEVLKRHRITRSRLKFEANHQITCKMVNYIVELSHKYDIYIGLGDLKFLKQSTRDKSRYLRKMIHPFTYYQLTQMLEHKLGKYKLDKKLTLIKEYYTSSKCWKCNVMGKRPKQDRFICMNINCKWTGHADLNGAVNIAKRTIAYLKLTPVSKRGTGLGKYLLKLSHKPSGKPSNKGVSRSKPAGKSQESLVDFFEYDQPERPGNPALMTSH